MRKSELAALATSLQIVRRLVAEDAANAPDRIAYVTEIVQWNLMNARRLLLAPRAASRALGRECLAAAHDLVAFRKEI